MAENIARYSSVISPAAVRAAGIVLHRWLGITVGFVFVIAGLTGALLAYAPELTGAMFPQVKGPPAERWEQSRGHVLQRIEEEYSAGQVTLVRFPSEDQGAYELYLADDTLQYRDPITGDVVLRRTPYSDVLSFSRELHTHLFLGHEGEELLGWLGIAMLVLLATGLWLWWPRPGLWRFAFKRPTASRLGPQLYWWHKTIGFMSIGALFFVTLTGVAMVFYTPAQKVLTGLFGGEAPLVPRLSETSIEKTDWPRVLASLDTTLPEGRTVFLYPPACASETLRFRKQMPGELHPNGRSFVAISRAGNVLHANDATEQELGMRATNAIYPLHAGKADSEAWRFIVFLMGIAPAFFFVTGFWLWRLRRRRREKKAV